MALHQLSTNLFKFLVLRPRRVLPSRRPLSLQKMGSMCSRHTCRGSSEGLGLPGMPAGPLPFPTPTHCSSKEPDFGFHLGNHMALSRLESKRIKYFSLTIGYPWVQLEERVRKSV